MICKNCGAHLTLENKSCLYCGTPNPEAAKQKTSKKVILVCSMGLICTLSILFFIFSWDMAYSVRKIKASTHSKAYCQVLDQYEEEKDFLSFTEFFDQNSLYSVDAFKQYRYVYNVASNYTSIYGYISRLIEEEHWEEGHENALEYLCESLEYHYKYLERDPDDYYSEIGAYDKKHLQAVENINKKIENLLQFTFQISDEEMDQFKNLSTAEKQVFIERRFDDYE